MDEETLMITGAKKKNEIKNYDKNNLTECLAAFKKFFISNDSLIKDSLAKLGLTGEIETNYIRPSYWKFILNIFPSNSDKLEDWILSTTKQRNEFKNKLRSLNSLKKFSGDPLGGSTDVS